MTHLDSDDFDWINVYQPNDTMIFCSDRNHTDTLVVLLNKIKNSKFPFYLDTYSSEYIASGCIVYYLYGTRDSISGTVWFDKFYKNEPVIQSFRLGELTSIILPWLIPRPRKLLNITVDDKVFNNCVVIDSACANWGRYVPDSTDISKFVWSKEHGIIMYQQINGEKFTLTKRFIHD